MQTLNIFLFVLVLFDTLLLVAISISVSKFIDSIQKEEPEEEKSKISPLDPPLFTDGFEKRLSATKNWDGISREE